MDPHKGELDPRFSSPDATATPWTTARDVLAAAPTYWLSTVRSDGGPHVTTIAGVWIDEALHFTTGPSEQKAKKCSGLRACGASGRSTPSSSRSRPPG